MPRGTSPQKDLYEVLQVHPFASQEMVRRAFGWLAKQYHPDNNPDRTDWAEGQMRALNEAFEILSDPAKRRDYDLTFPGVRMNGRAFAPRARNPEGGPGPGWKPSAYESDTEGEPGFRSAAAEAEARKKGYYVDPDEAYADAGAPPGSAEYERRRGQDYLDRKRYDRAVRHFRRALNLAPENAMLMVELGMAYYLNLNLTAAREWLEKALQRHPSIADAHYMLGMIALDGAVIQAVERDSMGVPLYKSRSQRRYFAVLGEAVRHFEQALYLRPDLFRRQFGFFPLRKTLKDWADNALESTRDAGEFARDAKTVTPFKTALIDWYFDHAQQAFTEGAGSDDEFLGNLRRLMPKSGVKMFLNSWGWAALRRGLELYPEELALLKAYEKLLATSQFLGEQPMSRDLAAELRRSRGDTYVKIKAKDASYAPTTQTLSTYQSWSMGLVAVAAIMVLFLVSLAVQFFTSLGPG